MNAKEKPLVSVVIPTHNRVALLQEALDSVCAMEGADGEFKTEVLVVEDDFSEATRDVVRRYPQARYIQTETNRGASAARNTGVRASKGKYVAFLDDDDLCLPNRLKVQVPVLESCPEVGVVYGQLLVEGEGEPYLWPDPHRAPSGAAFQAFLMEEFINPSQVMIRREAFEQGGYFDEALRTMEHYDFFLRLALRVPFTFIPAAVAIGRFAEWGKWFTNIKAGVFQQNVPYIVDRALAMLPDTTETFELRRKAYISWFPQTTYLLERAGNFDGMRGYVLAMLQSNPWMVTDGRVWTAVVKNVEKVARELALASSAPIASIRAFCAELKAATDGHGAGTGRATRRLLAHAWMATAQALMKSQSLRSRRSAAYATACAILHNPVLLRRTYVWKMLIRGTIFADPRFDPIISALKRKIR